MKKILVIQQKMIGDVLLSSLICDNLRKAYPNAQIDYLVNANTAQVLEGNPAISNLVLFTAQQENSLIELIKFGRKLRAEHYDLVIDAYSKLQSWIIVYLSKGRRRISYKKTGRTFLYTDNIEKISHSESNLGLAIEHRLSLLDPLNLSIEKDIFPKIYVSEEEHQLAGRIFESFGIDTSKKTIMISALGSDETKTYPLQYMAEIVDYIGTNYDVNLLFNYFPKEKEKALVIYNSCSEITKNKIYFDVLGRDLREFIAIMSHCDAIVGNDGGSVNMAKALGKKSFIIFSPWIEKKNWATFEDGLNHTSVHLNDFKPELFLQQKTKDLKKQSTDIYKKFIPSMILPKLALFLKNL